MFKYMVISIITSVDNTCKLNDKDKSISNACKHPFYKSKLVFQCNGDSAGLLKVTIPSLLN